MAKGEKTALLMGHGLDHISALENPSVQRSVRAAVLITTVFHVEALVDSWLSRIIKCVVDGVNFTYT